MEAREMMESHGRRTVFDEGYAQYCEKKWGKLLQGDDGVRQPYMRKVTAMLLENEMDHVKRLTEDTLSTNAGSFTKYVFPVLRRVFPNLIANQLVSVQPEIRYGLMAA